jgi:hypothetical protein
MKDGISAPGQVGTVGRPVLQRTFSLQLDGSRICDVSGLQLIYSAASVIQIIGA